MMGKITTPLTIINRADQAVAERGLMPADQIRSVAIPNALVDTGATTLCLPSDLIVRLGLSLLRQVDVVSDEG